MRVRQCALAHFGGWPDPDRGFGIWTAFGIGMEAEEIHAELGQLSKDGFVIVGIPPVGSFGEIVKRLDASHGKERLVPLTLLSV
jgi:hypothetical protein